MEAEPTGGYSAAIDPQEAEKLKKSKFNVVEFNQTLKDLTADLTDINPELFCTYLLEVTKIFNEMSSALAIAFQGNVS